MRRMSFALVMTVVATGCAPSEYMGISTSGPLTSSEQALLDYAERAGLEGGGSCYANNADDDGSPMPCELVPLTTLAKLASLGNRHAQLELGKRFESGRGVARDLSRAETLYVEASKNSGGPIWIYVPGVGDARGRVQQIDTPIIPGLPEANMRLRDLRLKRGT